MAERYFNAVGPVRANLHYLLPSLARGVSLDSSRWRGRGILDPCSLPWKRWSERWSKPVSSGNCRIVFRSARRRGVGFLR